MINWAMLYYTQGSSQHAHFQVKVEVTVFTWRPLDEQPYLSSQKEVVAAPIFWPLAFGFKALADISFRTCTWRPLNHAGCVGVQLWNLLKFPEVTKCTWDCSPAMTKAVWASNLASSWCQVGFCRVSGVAIAAPQPHFDQAAQVTLLLHLRSFMNLGSRTWSEAPLQQLQWELCLSRCLSGEHLFTPWVQCVFCLIVSCANKVYSWDLELSILITQHSIHQHNFS